MNNIQCVSSIAEFLLNFPFLRRLFEINRSPDPDERCCSFGYCQSLPPRTPLRFGRRRGYKQLARCVLGRLSSLITLTFVFNYSVLIFNFSNERSRISFLSEPTLRQVFFSLFVIFLFTLTDRWSQRRCQAVGPRKRRRYHAAFPRRFGDLFQSSRLSVSSLFLCTFSILNFCALTIFDYYKTYKPDKIRCACL